MKNILILMILLSLSGIASAKTVHSNIKLNVVGISDTSRTIFMFSEETIENNPCGDGGKKLLRYEIDKENSLWKEIYSTALTAWVSQSTVTVGFDDEPDKCWGGASGDAPRILTIRLHR